MGILSGPSCVPPNPKSLVYKLNNSKDLRLFLNLLCDDWLDV